MMVLMAGVELPVRAIREQIALRFDLIVHLVRLVDGSRRVSRITEVSGLEGDVVDAAGSLHRPLTRGHVHAEPPLCAPRAAPLPGLLPGFLPKLATSGVDLPANLSTRPSSEPSGARHVARRGDGAVPGRIASGANGGGRFSVRRRGRDRLSDRRRLVRGGGSKLPRLYENGQRLVGAETQNLGRRKAIVLAIDRSKSMSGAPLLHASAAAASFVHRKPAVGLRLGRHIRLQRTGSGAAFPGDDRRRHRASHIGPGQRRGTALYDAVVVASTKLAAQTYPGRVLILLTDGRDVRSLATLNDAVRSARRAGVVVYAIALGHAHPAPLRRLARETGGILYSNT